MISYITNFLTGETNLISTLTILTTIIIIYSVFVFYFYRFLAKKNIIELNLGQYNHSNHPVATKLFAIILYVLEYIIILPVVTFFWFATLSILILVIAKEINTGTILLISASLVASVRVTSYISESLSRDLAKMIPFTLLAIAITTAGFFNTETLVSRISEIPGLISDLPYYLLFIAIIELIMRSADLVQSIFLNSETIEED